MDKGDDDPKVEKSGSQGQNAEEKRMPSDCVPVNAINPLTGKEFQLFVRSATIALTGRKGMGAAKELAETVLDAVQKPKAIFRGMTEEDGEDGTEDWLIYVGRPAFAYDFKTGKRVNAWKGEVFLVFVDEDRIIQRWRWAAADQEVPNLPQGFDDGRFLERLI